MAIHVDTTKPRICYGLDMAHGQDAPELFILRVSPAGGGQDCVEMWPLSDLTDAERSRIRALYDEVGWIADAVIRREQKRRDAAKKADAQASADARPVAAGGE